MPKPERCLAPADYDERIRDILTVWAGKILDYAHRDYYELVRFYYRPRVEAFLAHAQTNFGKPDGVVNDQQLESRYHEIEQAWVQHAFHVAESEKYARGPTQAVTEIVARYHPDDRPGE